MLFPAFQPCVRLVRTSLVAAMAILAPVAVALPAAAQETAVAPEKNPPGDIPDDQIFVTYTSPQGFTIKVPEGWSRTDRPDGVSFADKYGRIDVAVSTAPAPTVASVRATDVPALEQAGHAVKVGTVQAVTLPAGAAVRITYAANSEPNPVTGKRIRLENERTLIPHAGQLAILTFAAPAGADNADQWKLMADSFRWR